MDVKIRIVTAEDAPAVCRICCEDLGYECGEALVLKRITELDCTREAVYVAEVGGEVSGYIHAELYRTLYFETMCNILRLAVSKKCRRMGLGRMLVQACEEWAKQNGVHLMRVNSGMGRTGAHEFYRNSGYTDEKEQKRFLKRI